MGDKELDKLEQELGPLSAAERERDFQKRAFGFATGVIVCVGIWALTGGNYFWPGWVILFGGIDIARRAYTTYANPPPEPDELDDVDDPDELAP